MNRILFLGSPEREETFLDKISVDPIDGLSGQNNFIRVDNLKDAEIFIRGPLLNFVAVDLYKLGKNTILLVPRDDAHVETILAFVRNWFRVPDPEPRFAKLDSQFFLAGGIALNLN